MKNPCASRHDLNISGGRASFITLVIFVRNRASSDIGDNFHIPMRMCVKPCVRGNAVIINDHQLTVT